MSSDFGFFVGSTLIVPMPITRADALPLLQNTVGVEDFFVLQEDPKFRFAISLGIFKTEEAAQARLAELRKKGVRTARVGPKETSVHKVYFTVREVPEELASRLNELRQGFPGSELKDCPPEERRAGK